MIHVFEEYESSKAHLDHFANLDLQAVGRLVRARRALARTTTASRRRRRKR